MKKFPAQERSAGGPANRRHVCIVCRRLDLSFGYSLEHVHAGQSPLCPSWHPERIPLYFGDRGTPVLSYYPVSQGYVRMEKELRERQALIDSFFKGPRMRFS